MTTPSRKPVQTTIRRALIPALALLCALSVAFSCAPRPVAGPETEPLSASELWTGFRERAAKRDQSFILTASILTSQGNRSYRARLRLWGNTGYPLRLDVSTSFGTTAGLFREDAGGWLGYYPDEATAYTHTDSRAALGMFGLNLPFDIRDLTLVLSGRVARITPSGYDAAVPVSDGFRYTFQGPTRLEALTLDRLGRAFLLEGRRSGWTVELSGYDSEAPDTRPSMVRIRLADDSRAVIRLKSFEARETPWPREALDLALPEGTPVVPLDASPKP